MSVSLTSLSSPQSNPPHLQNSSPQQTKQPASTPVISESNATTSPYELELLNAYLAAVQSKALGKTPELIKVAPQSTLGQWLELYRTQWRHPVVQGWMQEQKIDQTAVLSLNPLTGELTATANSQQTTFNLADNSGWGQISGPLLAAAKVVAPGNYNPLQVRLSDPDFKVHASVVANFHAESLPTSLPEARAQIRRLDRNKAFDPIPADDRIRPASARSPQAIEQLKLNAQTYYTQAPQALAYKHLAVEIATTLPNVRAEAKKWAESVILELTGKHEDADKLYLNRFNTSESSSTAITGWEHMNDEPTSSLRLPDALLKNFSENDWVPNNLDSEAGIYRDGPGKSTQGGYGAHNELRLRPSALMKASWKTDFQGVMTKKIDDFWANRSGDYQTAIRGEFVYQARKQLKAAEAKAPAERALLEPEQRFTREDYRLVMGAAPNVALDENSPLSVDQLRSNAPFSGTGQAHAFNIKGFVSNDMVRFSAADGGRQVLYMPGTQPAFLRFDSLEKLDQWVIDQTKDPKKREALLTHFPLIARQDHEPGAIEKTGFVLAKALIPLLGFTKLGAKTDGLDSLCDKLASGELKVPTFTADETTIKGDVFSAMTSASQARMTSDADVVIKSNSEVVRDIWLNDITVAAGLLAKLAPIAAPVAAAAVVTGVTEIALGEEKQASGDTLAERNDGAAKAFDGVLNTLFSVGASGVAKDPFIPPEEKPVVPSPGEPPQVEGPKIESVPDDRLRPTQTRNLSQYVVPNGEQLIETATRNAKGMYQVKDAATGQDRWFIHYTDNTSVRQVYEIRSDFKLSDDYVQIINRETGKPVMTVHSNGKGEWVNVAVDAGMKWPWRSAPSTPLNNESQSSSKFAQRFLQADGSKIEGAEKFDDYLKLKGDTDYLFSNNLYMDGTTVKRRLTTSWQVDDGAFVVSSGEKAQPSPFSDSEYSSSFAPDLNRESYSVVTKQPTGELRTNIDFRGDTFEDTVGHRIAELEAAIPNPELRARISEVAHQGSSFPALEELTQPALKEGFAVSAREKSFIITYDPVGEVHTVKAITNWQLRQITEDGLINVKDLDIVSTRTFTIRESNELDSAGFTIDPSAPTKIEISTPAAV
ncbi:dermonecrotic toxin domain-containing protein [Pseudomonas rhodesiae]|uniref:dermonecrotic toxin domain-containing protein n=1 Tax=Pseudomonas rhodesiae TaxID=76760 RepID=UPI0032B1E8E7